MNILAIEISTSSVKTLLYSSETGIQDVFHMNLNKEACDIASQDAECVYKSLIQCIKKITCSEKYTGKQKIDAISICTTWHSILYLDDKRNPIERIYTWANNKAAATTTKYRKDQSFTQWYYKKTGCMVNCTYPCWQWMHFKNTYPEKASKVRYFSSQQEYIFEKLTGEIALSKSIASGSGFFNIHTLDWDDEILEFASINRAQMSDLHEPTYFKPLKKSIAKEMNLPPGIPVILGSPDGGMNQVGSAAVKKNIMTFSVGTSAALRIAVENFLLPENPSTWCYYLGEGKRIAGASTAGAGNCVSWFINNYPSIGNNAYVYFDGLLENVLIKDAPLFMPFLYGERCPGWQDYRLGGFNYLKADHEIKDLYYAVLEGVLFNIFHCYNILTDLYGRPEEIRISGGILKSAQWTQMAADIFNREIIVCDFEHQSLIGATVMALKALDQIKLIEDFNPLLGRKVAPNESLKSIYSDRFQKYLDIYNV